MADGSSDPHDYPATVDIPLPPEGLGSRMDEMRGWCEEQFGAGRWMDHETTVAWPPSAPGEPVVRFCFFTEEDAEHFERRWCR